MSGYVDRHKAFPEFKACEPIQIHTKQQKEHKRNHVVMAAFCSIQRDESYFNQRTIHVAKLSQNFHICLWSIVDSRVSSKIHIMNVSFYGR